MFAPIGDGRTRRRGSDGLRVGVSVVAVFLCWLVTHANSNAEREIATALASPPQGVKWLIGVIWWLASFGVIALIAILVLVDRRWKVLRDIGLSGLTAWVLCVLSSIALGSTGGRPPSSSLQHFDLSFPVARVAATVAVATAALPYLSRMIQLTIETAIGLLALTAVVSGSGLPVAVLASLAVGWGVTALDHLIFGSPLGLPSSEEVAVLLADLDLTVEVIAPATHQEWGVGRFIGRIGASEVDVSVYGRDASDAQLLAKTSRFLFYRSSGPTLALTRRQQVEHEAFLTLMAERAGARVPAVLAAGPAGPAHDAVLVTRPPSGRRLSEFAGYEPPVPPAEDDAVPGAGTTPPGDRPFDAPEAGGPTDAADRGPVTAARGGMSGVEGRDATAVLDPDRPVLPEPAVDDVFAQLMVLRRAAIAHGALSTETLVVGADDRVGFVDFRSAVTVATEEDLDRDMAAALAAVSVKVGPDRAVSAALRSVPTEVLVAALPFLQRAALDPAAARALRGRSPS